MARALLAITLLVAAFLAPGGQASSLRSRRIHARNPGLADSFRKNFGWPGFKFPADRWGVVMDSQEAEKAAAAEASSTIVPPNLGTAPVNIAPSPSSDLPPPIFTALSIVSSVPQAVPTSTGLSGISVSNLTSSASPSSIPEPTSSPATPLVNSSSSSATPSHSVPSPSFAQTPSQKQASSHVAQSSSVPSAPAAPSPSSSPPSVSSHSVSPPASHSESPPASHSPSPPPAAPIQPSSPVNVGSAPGSSSQASNQGNQGGSSSSSNSGSGPTSPADIQAYLTAHNTVRAQHGAAPLTYSQSLAAKAQQWVNGCVFQHSGGSLGPFGENLAAGTGSGYGIPQAIGSWTAEASQYDPNNPQPSHFTQVVWKSTTEVGCAEQDCSGIFPSSFGLAHYYVCEYSPQGNVIGEFPANVQV